MIVDLGIWLSELGLGRYVKAFEDNGIAADVLHDLDEGDLKELGLTLGDRKRLLKAVAALRADLPGVAEEPAAPRQPERRQLTVMFCDLAGSTALSERLDLEEMRDLIQAYQTVVAHEITRFEGLVAKFMGDGVLAYFGWPQAHEDDAERALRAGLAIVEAVCRIQPPGGDPLACRIGIATGLVVVGELIGTGAAREEAVSGPIPNLAARLQAAAAPGSVVISEATRRLVRDAFEMDDLGERGLKGFSERVRLWRVLRLRRTAGRFAARQAARVAPLVGREEELALLVDTWRQAANGRGQVVLLVGEPGVGKSRLLQALQEDIAETLHTALLYQCSPHHLSSALHPVIDQLEQSAGFARGDSPEQRFAKLEALLELSTCDLMSDLPLIANLWPLPLHDRYSLPETTPQRRKELTLEALLRQLQGLSGPRPVLLLLEDAHWIDPTTAELFEMTVERIPDLKVLLVVAARPEYEPAWHTLRQLTPLTLSRLNTRESAALAQQVADKALPRLLLDQIVAKADGVALFVEELTKSIVESGLLVEQDSRYGLAPLGQLEIPSSLHDSLMARLDRLGPVKEVAQIGACIGREFNYSLVSALGARSPTALNEALDQLVASELVFCRDRGPDAIYTFKHALVRDAAYHSLLHARRRSIHCRIAEVIEQHFRDMVESSPELLAQHYTAAGRTAPAIAYWRKAGARALLRFDNGEASAHFSRALELLETCPDTEDSAEVELQCLIPLGHALSVTRGRGSPEVDRTYARAWDLCRDHGDRQQSLSVLIGLWACRFVRADFQAAQELAEQWPVVAGRVEDAQALAAIAAYMRGGPAYFRGDVVQARAHFERGLDQYDVRRSGSLARRYGLVLEPSLAFLCWGAQSMWLLGDPDQALLLSQSAQALARELEHPPSAASVSAWTALFHASRRDVEAAHAHAAATVALATELGFPFRLAEGMIARGWALVSLGETSAGLTELKEGIQAWQATGALLSRPWWLAMLAQACELAGKMDDGLDATEQGLERARETEERLFEAELHRVRGRLLLHQAGTADHREIEACFLRAIKVAKHQQTKMWELRAATSLAEFWAARGERRRGFDLLAPILGTFTEGFETVDLIEAGQLVNELR